MIVFYTSKINDELATLIGDESIHCSKVLRKKIDDEVFVTDGRGHLYEGIISHISKKEVVISLTSEIENQPKPHKRSIAIAPTKNIDRFEWFLEKSTEIGITDIYPFLSSRSERKVIKPERLEKIIISAMKQSKNLHKPILHQISPLKQLLTNDFGDQSKFIAHCMDPKFALQNQYESGSNAIVLIGPEGDFTQEEVDMSKNYNWEEISLGKARLRTETAGIVACHLLNL
jgi:16S rRNA (uracil1498-N3)-methyltransferase